MKSACRLSLLGISTLMYIFLFLSCRDGRDAAEAWAQAEIQEKTDRKAAIVAAEELIVAYPKSDAATKARKQVPYWIHAEYYRKLVEIVQEITKKSSDGKNLDFMRSLSKRLSGSELARPLVRVLEDYPEYELRELAEMQVVCMAMWEPIVRAVLSHKIWNEEFKVKTEAAIRFEGSYDEMMKVRIELVAETMRGFKAVMLEMAGGLMDAGKEMEELSERHSRRSAFVEGSRILKNAGTAAEEVAEAVDYAIEFYEDEGFECSQAANSISDGFFSRLGRSWTLRGCKNAQERIEERLRPASKELERAASEMSTWFERSKLRDYLNQLEGLDHLQKAIGGS